MTEASAGRQAPDTADTREKILDAAESLFIELGYSATSLRAIAAKAGVNLAATNYHFGSKQGLFAAVFLRRIEPVNEARLLRLKELEDSGRSLTLRSILECFYQPVLEAFSSGHPPAVLVCIFREPESLTKPIMQQAFGEVAMRFQAAMLQALPGLSADELQWRFHFMIGSMAHLLQFQAPLMTESSPGKFTEGMERLIDYSIAGLTQDQPADQAPHDQPEREVI